MFKLLRSSRRHPELTRRGFLVKKSAVRPIIAIDATARHPLFVLLVGFVLTGFVGSWITFSHDDRQKQNDATVRSFDELRSTTDDLTTSFAEYETRTSYLLRRIVNGKDPAEISKAESDYEASYVNWRRRLAADGPLLQQALDRGPQGYTAIDTYLDQFDMTTFAMDHCLNNYLVSSDRTAISIEGDLVCLSPPPLPSYTAMRKLRDLSDCLGLFAMVVRPSPKFDFDSRALQQARLTGWLDQMASICSTKSKFDVHANS